jgi:hypothetical protein
VTIRMGYGFRNIDNLIALVRLKCAVMMYLCPVEIAHTNGGRLKFTLGSWFLRQDASGLSVSNDNIYYEKLYFSKESAGGNIGDIRYIYEYGENLIFELFYAYYRTPKQLLYDELNRMKTAPYIEINNTILGFDEPPVIQDGRTLVPMRFLFEQMGADVDWNNETQTATAKQDNSVVAFEVGENTAKVNGKVEAMDVAPQLVNGKTFVPLRFLSENLGYNVEWDDSTRTAKITK